MSRNADTGQKTRDTIDEFTERSATVSVTNVGGIDDCEVTLSSGITILTGRNATNRTSFLSAIAGVLGGTAAMLKADADYGGVELALDGETYTREYTRQAGTVSVDGDPFVDEPEYVDTFACLLEDNPARRAVERGDDLREVIMRPVDTDQLRDDIRNREAERDDLRSKLDDLEATVDRRPKLERRRDERRADLEAVEDELADVRETVDAFDAAEAEAEEAESLLDELEELRGQLDDALDRKDHQESELRSLRTKRADVAAELDDIESSEEELDELDQQSTRLKRRKREVENEIDDLVRVVEFTEDLLAGETSGLRNVEDEGDVAADLDPSSKTMQCWTCGSRVEQSDIDERLETLRNLVTKKQAERDSVESDLTTVEERRRELERSSERQAELRSRLDELDREISHREQNVTNYEDEAATLRAEIDDLQEQVEETGSLREDVLSAYRALSELEYERGKLESDLSDAEAELAAVADAAEERDRVTDRLSVVQDELASLRSRIDDLEREAVEAFNEEMASVLDLLEYDIARVWIERKTTNSADDSSFDLHVVRESDGAMYEDTVATLSESERETIGLVVALAGFLVHEVYEFVPFVLLDSLEAIDSDRIVALVDYFAGYAPFLAVAVLPEDAQAFSNEYDRIPAEQLG